MMNIEEIKTNVFNDQKPGTSGLRKKVTVFQQEFYTENFIQAIFDAQGDRVVDSTFAVGGDGRYYVKEVVSKIIKIAAANKVGKLVIGQNGIFSTPAISNYIRKYKTNGAIVLTASHNPGGPDNDFGIKLNCENGGPAPDQVTNLVFEISKSLKSFKYVPNLQIDIGKKQATTVQVGDRKFVVEVINPVEDYVVLMKEIFDFPSIQELVHGSAVRPKFELIIDCLNGVTGPYAQHIFGTELGMDKSSIVNSTPLEDFGGLHPDPNLTYASNLVNTVEKGVYDMGAAFDGDGDRNMIIGKNAFFVNPSDSLAVLADNLELIPYFRTTGIKGFARSMPTSSAVDRVASNKACDIFEVPTGWKYFGNLMDAGLLSLCGEESFGTGSDHIREKDGIWACLAWLNIIAKLGKSIKEVLTDHWTKYGRNFFTRYDYEGCEILPANKVMTEIVSMIKSPKFIGTNLSWSDRTYVVQKADDFSYKDIIDHSFTVNQGLRIIFEDGSRIVFRLSGTGSSGATIRLYIESYETDPSTFMIDAQVILKPLINIALTMSKIEEYTGRKFPTVIT